MRNRLMIAFGVSVAISGCSQSGDVVPDAEASTPPATTETSSVSPTSEVMLSQDEAIAASVAQVDRAKYNRFQLVSAPFGPILVGEFRAEIDEHGTPGRLDAFYLTRSNGSWKVAQSHTGAVKVGSMGTVAEWAPAASYLTNPVIVLSGGFTGQGVTESCTVITELAPTGPRNVAVIPAGIEHEGSTGGPRDQTTASIGSIRQNEGFTVTYSGTKAGTVPYRWSGEGFEPQGKAPIEGCGPE